MREYEAFDRRSLLVDFYISGSAERKREKADNCSIRRCVLINENARERRAKRTRYREVPPLSLFQVKSFRVPFSLLVLRVSPRRENRARIAAILTLIGHRHLFTVVGRPCSPGASAASRRRRLGALLNTVRRWQALTGCNEVGSARVRHRQRASGRSR